MNQIWVVIGLLLTNAGFLFGMWKYFTSKIDRVYVRLDEVKENMDSKFVHKDMCALMHSSAVESIRSIEERLNARFDKMEKNVESLFNQLVVLMTKNG